MAGKRIAILGFAFKKDTNDTRESPAITVCRDLLAEEAHLAIYDPRVPGDKILEDLGIISGELPVEDGNSVDIVDDAYEACEGAHAVAILTEWDEFKSLDFEKTYDSMKNPAFVFDGRNILDLQNLRKIGFEAVGIGKP